MSTPDLTRWNIDSHDGDLLVGTGVTGRAAKLGHSLVIAMQRWQVSVSLTAEAPTAAELTVAVDSLEVARGVGGIKALSEPEKDLARSNALKSFDPDRHPQIRFAADIIEATDDGYRLTGDLQICGTTRRQAVDVETRDTGDRWRLSSETAIRPSDFRIRPPSILMGSVRVVDTVTVWFSATRTKNA